MNIAILTLSLGTNYGGILQAYALQNVLRKSGHNAITIDYNKSKSIYYKAKIKRILPKILLGRKVSFSTVHPLIDYTKNIDVFLSKNIRRTEKIYSPIKNSNINIDNFDAIIVGSDQVWRPEYLPYPLDFFLDFIPNNHKIKKIAYAASFGRNDICEFSADMIVKIKPLLGRFDAISVRENSAISLLKDNFNASAEWVLDPTMLLSKSDYVALVEEDEKQGILDKLPSGKRCFAYILDSNSINKQIHLDLSKHLNLSPCKITKREFPLIPSPLLNTKDYMLPHVTEWLRMFRDSDFILTDSFHGTVFAILFNKPFITLGNYARGQARFNSLFDMFDLKDRLTSNPSLEIIHKEIDWDKVNSILCAERQKANSFLLQALQ